jgi:hypothetical protein
VEIGELQKATGFTVPDLGGGRGQGTIAPGIHMKGVPTRVILGIINVNFNLVLLFAWKIEENGASTSMLAPGIH